jgi:8-oxo-dGTP diphosphatase
MKRIINGKEDWSLPGGRIENNESINETLKRELKEELGMDIEVGKYIGDYYFFRIVDNKKVICSVYECKMLSDEINLNQNEDIVSVEWLDKKEVLKKNLSSKNMFNFIKNLDF